MSVSAGGVQGDGDSGFTDVKTSLDGHVVAFESFATTLVPGDTNHVTDVFVRDLRHGTIERVSVATGGAQADFFADSPAISLDGRYVAFESYATNLVPNDTNGAIDIFVRDRLLRTTERVSVDSNGLQADGASTRDIAISPDGRYVAFCSHATNLVAHDTNNVADIFVHDRLTGATELVSISTGGIQANADSIEPSISADGRYVAFASMASNLVAGDTNLSEDVFLRDRQAGTTERVSVATGGAEGDYDSGLSGLAISADGRCVAFYSTASNLVAGDTNGHMSDIFVRDLQAGTTELVSISTNGLHADGNCELPSISSTGRYVAFTSRAQSLVPNDSNGTWDVFLRDRARLTTERVSVATGGGQSDDESIHVSISGTGRYVAFSSRGTDLVPGDTNGFNDVFLHDEGAAIAFTAFCFGDGSVAACPCGNSGAAGHGCENSAGTGGALLAASGDAELSGDTATLSCSGTLPSSLAIFVQRTDPIPPVFSGDGLRCGGGTPRRLYVKTAIGGVVTAPGAGDASISARSAALGVPILPGATLNYQLFYRDASSTFCPAPPGGTFNTSNAIAIEWGF